MRHSGPGQPRAPRVILAVCLGITLPRVVVAGSDGADPREIVEDIFRAEWALKAYHIERLGESGATDVLWALDEVERQLETEAPPTLRLHQRGEILEAVGLARARLARPKERGGEEDALYLRAILRSAIDAGAKELVRPSNWAVGELCDLGREEELPLVREYYRWYWRDSRSGVRAIARAEERVRLAARGEEGFAEALRSEEPWKRNWGAGELREGDPQVARRVLRSLLAEVTDRARALVTRNAPREEHLAALIRWTGPYSVAYRAASDLGCLDSEGEFYIPQYLQLHH